MKSIRNVTCRPCVLLLLVCFSVGQVFAQSPSAKSALQTQEIVYVLSPFDTVNLSVYGEDDLKTLQRISDKGKISVPLLGDVAVGGLTVSEASNLIEREFVRQEFLRNPVVSLSIKEFAPKVATVLGEVEKPGSVEIPPGRNRLPIQVAIAGAGGLTGTAKATDIRVSSTNATGEKVDRKVNLDRLLNAKSDEDSIYYIVPNDIIFVPRRVF